MPVARCGCEGLSREAGWRLLWASLGIAAAVIVQALAQRAGFGATSGALLMAGAGLWGGWLLNPYARIPGLPSTAAGIMALAIYIAALSGPSVSDVSGGAMFMVLMLSVVVRSWQIGIAATAILAGAQVLAALS